MRRFTLPLIFISLTSAQTISMSPLFKNYFNDYHSLEILTTKGVRDSFNKLKDMDSNLSVMRSDLLFLANKGMGGFKWKDYDLVARIKKSSYLYFVTRDGESILNMSELRGKTVSIGRVEDMAGQYLQDILIDEVEYQVIFQSYDLEESLNRIEQGTLDYLFAFGTADFENSIKQHRSLISFPLPEEFKETLLKNEGFIRTDKSVRAENYVVVSKKIDSSFLVSVIKEFKAEKILLREADSRLGTLYPDISTIVMNLEREKEKKQENEQKRQDTAKLIAEIDRLKKQLSDRIAQIKSKIPAIQSQALRFEKESDRYAYKLKADQLLRDINVERDSLKLKSTNFERWKKEKDVAALEMLRDAFEMININLIRYDTNAKNIKDDIKIALLREKEQAIEKIKQEAKEEAMMLNGFNARY